MFPASAACRQSVSAQRPFLEDVLLELLDLPHKFLKWKPISWAFRPCYSIMGNDSLQGNFVAHTKLAAKGDQRLHLLPGRLRRNGRAMQVILLVELPHQCDSEIAVEAF